MVNHTVCLCWRIFWVCSQPFCEVGAWSVKKILSKTVVPRFSVKVSQHLQRNTCAGVPFLITLLACFAEYLRATASFLFQTVLRRLLLHCYSYPETAKEGNINKQTNKQRTINVIKSSKYKYQNIFSKVNVFIPHYKYF